MPTRTIHDRDADFRVTFGRAGRAALVAALVLLVLGSAASAPAEARRPLANLAHLDFLGDRVAPPVQAGHTTWRLGSEPTIGVLWTYADRNPDGTYRRIGGGPYDPASDTYAQGAFNADDVARAAVVYIRHWRQTRDPRSRRAAYELLRGLTYLQTATGPNAGNVVLWMQPDGTLNPSAEPREEPDPSDSGPSYWLARTVWALGEGHRAFARDDSPFAGFLRERLELSVAALERQVLVAYGSDKIVDGRPVPAWLIVDGADATAEAMLGLDAYVDAGGSLAARRALAQFADGVARLGAGSARDWPYGAVLPWALSRSIWHAWAAQMPTALAGAADRLGRADLLAPAIADTASFTPHLLVAGGPDNGWQPAPTDRVQIAYGADSRLQSLLAVANVARRPGLRRLAGVAASWYFGNNAAREPVYDPATGRTFDGVSGDGVVNRNSGAESTIHGLLSMLALDAAPDVARWARVASPLQRQTWQVLEAEDAEHSGGAQTVTPASAWTGESAWSGGAYVRLPPGARLEFGPVADEPGLVQPVALRTEGAGGGRTHWYGGGRSLGELSHDHAGAQGASPAPGVLEFGRLTRRLRASEPLAVTQATAGESTALDAAVFQPLVETLVLSGDGATQALLRSFASRPRERELSLPGQGRVTASSYDAAGRLVARRSGRADVRVTVPPGGFAIAERCHGRWSCR